IEPLRIASVMSSMPASCGLSHSEKLSAARPPSTSDCTSQDIGATFEYQRHFVRLLWQSKQESAASWRVRAESQFGSCVTGGFEWSRPYGMAWITTNKTMATTALQTKARRQLLGLRRRVGTRQRSQGALPAKSVGARIHAQGCYGRRDC